MLHRPLQGRDQQSGDGGSFFMVQLDARAHTIHCSSITQPRNCWDTISPQSVQTPSFQSYKLRERSHQRTERFTMVQPRAPDSYRSLYLSRVISPQMGLKLMAFDTTVSSTLNPLGFIAVTFQKVGQCVQRNAALGDIQRTQGTRAFTASALETNQRTPPTSSITVTFRDIKEFKS